MEQTPCGVIPHHAACSLRAAAASVIFGWHHRRNLTHGSDTEPVFATNGRCRRNEPTGAYRKCLRGGASKFGENGAGGQDSTDPAGSARPPIRGPPGMAPPQTAPSLYDEAARYPLRICRRLLLFTTIGTATPGGQPPSALHPCLRSCPPGTSSETGHTHQQRGEAYQNRMVPAPPGARAPGTISAAMPPRGPLYGNASRGPQAVHAPSPARCNAPGVPRRCNASSRSPGGAMPPEPPGGNASRPPAHARGPLGGIAPPRGAQSSAPCTPPGEALHRVVCDFPPGQGLPKCQRPPLGGSRHRQWDNALLGRPRQSTTPRREEGPHRVLDNALLPVGSHQSWDNAPSWRKAPTGCWTTSSSRGHHRQRDNAPPEEGLCRVLDTPPPGGAPTGLDNLPWW